MTPGSSAATGGILNKSRPLFFVSLDPERDQSSSKNEKTTHFFTQTTGVLENRDQSSSKTEKTTHFFAKTAAAWKSCGIKQHNFLKNYTTF